MPYLPNISSGVPSRLFTNTFLGLNTTDSISDGETWDERNLTSDAYPAMKTWDGPSVVASPSTQDGSLIDPGGILGKDALCLIDDGKVYFGSTDTGLRVSTDPTMQPKQLVSMGAYLCIWPDKKYLNTVNLTDYGDMAASFATLAAAETTVQMCRLDGTDYASLGLTIAVSPIAPEDPANGALWIDNSSSPHVLNQYSEASGTWAQVATTYLKIGATGIGADFAEYDTVHLGGFAAAGTAASLPENTIEQLRMLDGDMIVFARDTNYIVVAGILDHSVTLTGIISAAREVPDLDYITESNNRIWGCKYGMVNGAVVNEIYASKLGDFKNWHSFMGLSTDSYTVSVGTDGKFTGACTLRGVPMFFKEGCVHKVSGSMPSNYSMSTTVLRGVEEGSERSMVITGETLYYKGRTEIMAYDGTLPQAISTPLGPEIKTMHNARAGAFGNKYWICLEDADGFFRLYVWDTLRGVWHRMEDMQLEYFAAQDDSLYAVRVYQGLDGAPEIYELQDLNGIDGDPADPPDALAIMGPFGYEMEDQKYLGRMNLRLQLGVESGVEVYLQYNGPGDTWLQDGGDNPDPTTIWYKVAQIDGPEDGHEPVKTVMLPILVARCDHFRIGFQFYGRVKLISMGRVYMGGADGP